MVLLLNQGLRPDEAAAVWIPHPSLGRVSAVVAPPITDETSYAVVLHEMGHHLSALGNVRNVSAVPTPVPGCHPRERHRWAALKLVEEDAAWEWAQHYALVWTVAMEQTRILCYGTYEEGRRRTR